MLLSEMHFSEEASRDLIRMRRLLLSSNYNKNTEIKRLKWWDMGEVRTAVDQCIQIVQQLQNLN
jgi:hypothetical protein